MEDNDKIGNVFQHFSLIRKRYPLYIEELNNRAFNYFDELSYWLDDTTHSQAQRFIRNLYKTYSEKKPLSLEITRNVIADNEEYFKLAKHRFNQHYRLIKSFTEALNIYFNEPDIYNRIADIFYEEKKVLSKSDFLLAIQMDMIHFFYLFEALFQEYYPEYFRLLKKEDFVKYITSDKHISLNYSERIKPIVIEKIHETLSRIGAIKVDFNEFSEHFKNSGNRPKINWLFKNFVPLVGMFSGMVPSGGKGIEVNNVNKEDMLIDHFCKANGEDFLRRNVSTEFTDTPFTKNPQKTKEIVELIKEIERLKKTVD